MSVESLFWCWLLLFNGILFLPRFLMEWKESAFLPLEGLLKGTAFERFRYISYRYNYDLFRFCFDWFLICLLLYGLRSYWTSDGMLVPLLVIYFILLLQLIYYNIFDKVFNLPPLYYNDVFMLWHGVKIAFTGFLIWSILALGGIILFSFLLFKGMELLLFYLSNVELSWFSYLGFALVFVMGLFSHRRYSYEQLPQQLVQSPIRSIWQNLWSSWKAKKNLEHLSIERLKKYNYYSDFTFEEKPNIYFLVVESYGRILLDDDFYSQDYQQWLQEHENKLKGDDWVMSTALSQPPIVGGASWLSYSSMLYGFRIDNQGTYLALSNHSEIDSYHSFFRLLQLKGYKNYQLNALGGFEKMKIPWERYGRYYGVDEWILFRDLNYQGKLYGFGPSPPDQYSLNFAANYIQQQSQHPFSLFYITQNSHSPFESPEEIVTDWQSLCLVEEQEEKASKFFEKPKQEDYKKAMKYQLDCLMDFVKHQGGENDLFIIVGDHQPPVLTPRESPQECPIHLIGHQKNATFIRAFENQHFTSGLLPDLSRDSMKHEGFYSLWMHHFLQHFSMVRENDLPAYFPDGHKLSNEKNP